MASDQDEFDAYYGESLDDESLAQVDLLASQQVGAHYPPPPATQLQRSSLLPTSHTRPAKRQRLDLVSSQVASASPQRPLSLAARNGYTQHRQHHPRRSPPPAPAPDDFEIAHHGPGRPPALGAGHGDALNKDDMWSEGDYDWGPNDEDQLAMAEHEASLVFSQQPGGQQHQRANEDGRDGKAAISENVVEDASLRAAMEQLRKERREMETKLQSALTDVQDRTNKMYARDGEIKIVRERNERAEKELAELRAAMQKATEDFQKQLEEREKAFAAEREKMDTNAAFNRLEAETSAKRTAWPGSARRRMPRGMGAASQSYSESYQAPVPPPVAPSTPTKRGQQQYHSPSRSRSGGRRNGDVDMLDVEAPESPSRSHAMRRAALPRLPGPTPKRPPGFAGFDNSFALDVPSTKKKASSTRQVLPTTHEHVRSPSPFDHAQVDIADTSHAPSTTLQQDLQKSRRERYVWAVAGLYRRRTDLLGLLLAHMTPCPLAPISLPASRYLETSVPSPRLLPDHTSTLHRLLNVRLPDGVAPSITARQRAATDLLLQSLSEGAGHNDGERRFAFLLHTSPDETPPKDERELVKIEEGDYWDCEDAIADGMQDLWDDVATALRVLMGLYLRLCMMDAFQDAVALMTSVAVIEPQFVNSLLMDPLAFEVDNRQGAEEAPVALPLPNTIESCVVEAVRKASATLPIHVLSPESAISDPAPHSQLGATQSRRARAKAKRDETASKQAWDMGDAQREAVLICVLDLLEILTWHMDSKAGRYLKPMIESPGFIMTFLDTKRSPRTMRRFVSLLTHLVQYKDVWKCIVACHFDSTLHPSIPHLITTSRTPLIELLAKHLVDLRHRQDPRSTHAVHVSIITLLSQLTLKHPDALLLTRESHSLFAALIQCIHIDTNAIWNDDGYSIYNVSETVTRISMDVRLLSSIFSADLIQRLNSHESHTLLNGISHCFILAFNRLAFADEPSWMDEDCVRRLQDVAELCGELVEMVLSPDEVEAAWEVCGAGEERDEEEEEQEDEEVVQATAFPPRETESFTQSDGRAL